MSFAHHPKAIRKRGFARFQHKIGFPYPNYGLGNTELPSICRCYYDGRQFFVKHEKDMHILYHNGAFGRSSTTFRGPSGSLDRPYQTQTYYKKILAKDFHSSQSHISKKIKLDDQPSESEESEKVIVMDTSESGLENCITMETQEELPFPSNHATGKCLDVAAAINDENIDKLVMKTGDDSVDSEKPLKHKTVQISTLKVSSEQSQAEDEHLILLPEEVIFLSFGVGSISIQRSLTGEILSFTQVWDILVRERPEFPYLYAVYHYFRSKNWVPKDGLQYGGDYVLYQVGPEFYHSTYIIHITGLPTRPKPQWTELYAWQRVANQCSKFVLLCNIEVPKEFQCETSNPRSIFSMKLNETIISRWTHSSAMTDFE